MSTTEKILVYNKPCPCSNGQIKIFECSPDHPYVRDKQTWYKGIIECKICKSDFIFKQIDTDDNRQLVLISTQDETSKFLMNIKKHCYGLSI